MRIYNESLDSFIQVHPTFLYESLLCFGIFIILRIIGNKRRFSGQLLYIYFILYGFGRSIIESLRTDSLMIGNIRISMILSVVLCVFCLVLYFSAELCRRKDKNVD